MPRNPCIEDVDALIELAEAGEDVHPLLTPAGRAWLDREVLAALLLDEIPELPEDDARDWAELAAPLLGERDATLGLADTGFALGGLCRERIRQIERKALRKCKAMAAARAGLEAVQEIDAARPAARYGDKMDNLGSVSYSRTKKQKATGWTGNSHSGLFLK